MDQPPLILFVGESLLMEGIALNLAKLPMLNVLSIEPALLTTRDCLHCLDPDLIICELETPGSESLIGQLRSRQHIHLAGLDPDSCHLVLLSSNRQATASIQQLIELIQSNLYPQPHPLGGI